MADERSLAEIASQLAALKRQVEDLQTQSYTPTGEAAGKSAYYRPDDGSLQTPGDIYVGGASAGNLRLMPAQGAYIDNDDDDKNVFIYRTTTGFSEGSLNPFGNLVLQSRARADLGVILATGNPPAARLVATDDGVGIGTNDPDYPLHVETTGQAFAMDYSGNTMGLLRHRNAQSGGWRRGLHFAHGLTGQTGDNAPILASMGLRGSGDVFNRFFIAVGEGNENDDGMFVIESNGNVGIGTASPNSAYLLHVAGEIYSGSNISLDKTLRVGSHSASGGVFRFNLPDDGSYTGRRLLIQDNGGTIQFYSTYATGGVGNMQFGSPAYGSILYLNASNGRVGIRKSNPEVELHIDGAVIVGSPSGSTPSSGQINAHAYFSNGTKIHDWVFDLWLDGYTDDEEAPDNARLWSIGEVESFIRSERHLPWLPGRKRWEEQRSSLGQLITNLWETAEQQQLHIFSLQERLDALERRL